MALLVREAGAEFEDLAEQNQRDNDGRRLEIERHLPVGGAERGGEDPRRQRRDDAVDIGDAGAERDQREHVEPAVRDRGQAALEERPAAPQHGRRAEDQLQPDEKPSGYEGGKPRLVDLLGHGKAEQRHRERDANPETPRHVAQLGIFGGAGRRRHRLQRHAADRAAAGLPAHDLRMHRAGPADLAGREAAATGGGQT